MACIGLPQLNIPWFKNLETWYFNFSVCKTKGWGQIQCCLCTIHVQHRKRSKPSNSKFEQEIIRSMTGPSIRDHPRSTQLVAFAWPRGDQSLPVLQPYGPQMPNDAASSNLQWWRHPCAVLVHFERVVLSDQKWGLPVLGIHVQTQLTTTR